MPKTITSPEIIDFLRMELSKFLSTSPETINEETPFEKYGLDSAKAVLMVGKLEDLLDVELPSTLLWDFNNIKSLSEHLEQNISQYQ
jgi:acyl carrier protein